MQLVQKIERFVLRWPIDKRGYLLNDGMANRQTGLLIEWWNDQCTNAITYWMMEWPIDKQDYLLNDGM